ncbi:hypothetical protein KC352_g62 [Hortaea werneckii]|nr:hypothetical protein KC352_g62 [Hortaea werneckii]
MQPVLTALKGIDNRSNIDRQQPGKSLEYSLVVLYCLYLCFEGPETVEMTPKSRNEYLNRQRAIGSLWCLFLSTTLLHRYHGCPHGKKAAKPSALDRKRPLGLTTSDLHQNN